MVDMKNILFRVFGKQRIESWYYSIECLLNPKYSKSVNKVKNNFRNLSDDKEKELRKSLRDNFFSTVHKIDYLSTEIGKEDMEDHIVNRLKKFRKNMIPWLNALLPLSEAKILEIGCGTGSTTITLAEQSANLTSIDIDENHIKVARKRCELYDLSVSFFVMNANQIHDLNETFDFIIFSACLEHMTYEERIETIKSAWSILNKGSYLVVVDTPNRLHYYDGHSSMLPFYHWLPDELAIQYSKYSPRQRCVDVGNSNDYMNLIRFGRGASFHEFEIALGMNSSEMIVSDMQSFNKSALSSIFRGVKKKYIKILQEIGPKDVPVGFYRDNLYIALKKS